MENESKPQGQVTIKFGKGLIGRSFTSKSGVEMLQVKIPNRERTDKTPWETFAVPAKMIHDNQYGKGVWMKLPEDDTTNPTINGVQYERYTGSGWNIAFTQNGQYVVPELYGNNFVIEDGMEIVFDYSPYVQYYPVTTSN